jgi:hypothetical protein
MLVIWSIVSIDPTIEFLFIVAHEISDNSKKNWLPNFYH